MSQCALNLRRFNESMRIESKKIQCESKRDSKCLESKKIQCESKNIQFESMRFNVHWISEDSLWISEDSMYTESRRFNVKEDSMYTESQKIQSFNVSLRKILSPLNLRKDSMWI